MDHSKVRLSLRERLGIAVIAAGIVIMLLAFASAFPETAKRLAEALSSLN